MLASCQRRSNHDSGRTRVHLGLCAFARGFELHLPFMVVHTPARKAQRRDQKGICLQSDEKVPATRRRALALGPIGPRGGGGGTRIPRHSLPVQGAAVGGTSLAACTTIVAGSDVFALVRSGWFLMNDPAIDTKKIPAAGNQHGSLSLLPPPGSSLISSSLPSNKKCARGDHCWNAGECGRFHTAEELTWFDRSKKLGWKTRTVAQYRQKACIYEEIHGHPHTWSAENCTFYHTESDAWCASCFQYGHVTETCTSTTVRHTRRTNQFVLNK